MKTTANIDNFYRPQKLTPRVNACTAVSKTKKGFRNFSELRKSDIGESVVAIRI